MGSIKFVAVIGIVLLGGCDYQAPPMANEVILAAMKACTDKKGTPEIFQNHFKTEINCKDKK